MSPHPPRPCAANSLRPAGRALPAGWSRSRQIDLSRPTYVVQSRRPLRRRNRLLVSSSLNPSWISQRGRRRNLFSAGHARWPVGNHRSRQQRLHWSSSSSFLSLLHADTCHSDEIHWLAGWEGRANACSESNLPHPPARVRRDDQPKHGIHVSRETFPSVRKLGRSEVGSLVVFADRSTGSISRRRQMHVSRDGSSTYIAWSAPRGGVACLRAPRSGAPLLGTIRRASNSRPTPILPKPRSPTKLASCVPSHRPPQASPLH